MGEPTRRGWQERTEPFRDEYLTLIWWVNRVGETMIVDAEELAAAAGIDPEHAASYLRALSTPFGQDTALYARIDQIRRRPYLDLGGGRYFCALPGGDLWALRPLFESAVKTGEAYQRHRGSWLERRAGELLAGALEPDELHDGVKLMSADGKRQLGEVDALLRLDDTVLAVEAKGTSMKPGARRGGESLIDHLRNNLTKAVEQGSLARAELRGEIEVKLVAADGSPLELGAAVREIHPIVVTLEDLSSAAPTLWQVAGTIVLPGEVTIPWVVTLFELEHVCGTVESPPQFVHFLRRRARLNQLGGRIASDELDWWMLYLDTSFYFEDEEPGSPTRRYLSLTDPLDAWVLYQRGLRKSAPRPLQRLDAKSRAMLRTLSAERPDGWIAAGCLLLECDDAGRRELHADLRAARRRAKKNHKVQRRTRGAKDRATEFLLAYVVVPDEGAAQLRDQLMAYVDERLGEHGDQRVLAIGATASSKRPYDAFVVIEHGRWDLPEAA